MNQKKSALSQLPKFKLEYTSRSFRFMTAKVYNELLIDIRKTKPFNSYGAAL